MDLKDYLISPNFRKMKRDMSYGRITSDEYSALMYMIAQRVDPTLQPKFSELSPAVQQIVNTLS